MAFSNITVVVETETHDSGYGYQTCGDGLSIIGDNTDLELTNTLERKATVTWPAYPRTGA